MKKIKEVLEKVYSNKNLRKSVVPLFIGNPGMGKTKIIEAFAEEKGAKLVELITSQMSPFEISGIAMPDKETKKMTYYNFDKLETLEDGDILFFDELLNGNPIVLNACLTILEQRRLISGKQLPDIMIIAAANHQGMVPLTPQIKERFLWYNVNFDQEMWKNYMIKTHNIPYNILNFLSEFIKEETFVDRNFHTPRSIDKAINMIKLNCPTPYFDTVAGCLETTIYNRSNSKTRILNGKAALLPGESISFINALTKDNPLDFIIKSSKKESVDFKLVFKSFMAGKKLATINLISEHIEGKSLKECRAIVELERPVIFSSRSCSELHLISLEDKLKAIGAITERVMEEMDKCNVSVDLSDTLNPDAKNYLMNEMCISESELEKEKENKSFVIIEKASPNDCDQIRVDLDNYGCSVNIF